MALPLFVTARLGSGRLPRKHLLALRGNDAALTCLVRRLAATKLRLVLCVPDDEAEQELLDLAGALGIDSFAGDADNVLRRYLQAIGHLGAPTAIIVDADDPFVSTEAIGELVRRYDGQDLITMTGLPYGGAATLMSQGFLVRLLAAGVTPHGWSGHIVAIPGRKETIEFGQFSEAEQRYRLSLDYSEDLDYVRHLYAQFEQSPTVTLPEVVSYITANRAVLAEKFPALFDGSLAERAQLHLVEGTG